MAGNSRPFLDFLREQRGGVTHDDLSDALQELVAAVSDTRKGGRMTFTVEVKPTSGDALEVSDKITLSLPKPKRNTSIFFATPENNLVRHDPRQQALPLQEIRKAQEVREIEPQSQVKAI